MDGEELHTAVAQVFNERGDGVVVRGGTAKISKADRKPHLTETDARKLLSDALAEYRRTHSHQPARIVLHKTSQFSATEVSGFQGAADDRDIDYLELIRIQRRGAPRLFRTGQLLPCAAPASSSTSAPSAVHARIHPVLPDLSRPVLALSKMNWNNAKLDERDPLTLRTAHRVAAIIRYVSPDAQIAARYAHYM